MEFDFLDNLGEPDLEKINSSIEMILRCFLEVTKELNSAEASWLLFDVVIRAAKKSLAIKRSKGSRDEDLDRDLRAIEAATYARGGKTKAINAIADKYGIDPEFMETRLKRLRKTARQREQWKAELKKAFEK